MTKVLTAEFVTTASKAEQCPPGTLPEVAFVGRSNVGKSSLINALANRNKLVRVSHTPGRTRALNFFDVTVERGGGTHTVRVCDLPGYGYAKVSKAERASWQVLISAYLQKRAQLRLVVSLIDASVGPTPDDAAMLDFLMEAPPRVLVVATKLDRLGKAKRKPALESARATLELPKGAVMGVSAVERLGLDELWAVLLDSMERKT